MLCDPLSIEDSLDNSLLLSCDHVHSRSGHDSTPGVDMTESMDMPNNNNSELFDCRKY
jgi:hypothetical protein